MPTLHRFFATSDHPVARLGRCVRRRTHNFSIPAPRIIVRPVLWAFLAIRNVYYFLMRVFICEPLFKAYCSKYGKNLHTGVFIHWVMGKGNIIIGDNVTLSGKSSFTFSPRFSDRPTLDIGSDTVIGSGSSFVVGKRIRIGRHCKIAGNVSFADSNGHSTDPVARVANLPPSPEDVRPIEIEDNVWIGGRAMILPGVTIGEGSIVAANSVVRKDVAPYTIVAGNPAVKVADVRRRVEDDATEESAGSVVE